LEPNDNPTKPATRPGRYAVTLEECLDTFQGTDSLTAPNGNSYTVTQIKNELTASDVENQTVGTVGTYGLIGLMHTQVYKGPMFISLLGMGGPIFPPLFTY
jgi:hypothetical protein